MLLKNLQKYLLQLIKLQKKPKELDILKIFSVFPDNPAMIAPTIITDDIALVTDIRGVCKEGVTLHTT